jgi:hypothetical protein
MATDIRRAGRMVVGVIALVLGPSATAQAQMPVEIDREPISYYKAPADDAITRLQQRIDKGAVRLKYDAEGQGFLKAVLEALGVKTDTQVLVFSKTSFQHTRIAPRTPRALYFSDDVYVGFVRGADVLEFSAVDPKLGAVFYLLDQDPSVARPKFVRQTDTCLQCHQSAKTQEVPGYMVRSVYPDTRGFPVFGAGSYVTDHTSPMAERWGGWYVTGTHGAMRHLGNTLVTDRDHPLESFDSAAGGNRKDLEGLVDTAPYLSGHSDLVALMVLEYQTQLHNLIISAGYQARIGRHYDTGINKALGRPADALSPSTERRIQAHADKLVHALLCAEEAKLTAPVTGTSGFMAEFPKRGPRDKQGRSLRDLDLTTRLFKYPCSYLVYSGAFDGLPEPVKDRVYHRLFEVLTGRDKGTEFAHLSPTDRRAIFEILLDTKPGLPPEWRAAATASRGD